MDLQIIDYKNLKNFFMTIIDKKCAIHQIRSVVYKSC